MKNLRIYLFALTAITFIGSTSLLAQTDAKTNDSSTICCNGRMWQDIPDLTQDQMKKIEDLQIAHLKEINQTKNQIAEKRVHLRTLQIADKVDNTAINKAIDEITAIQNDLMKKNEAHRQAVRNLLTDKQKVVFDAKHHGTMYGNGPHHGKGYMNGYGRNNRKGIGNGYGQHGQGYGCGQHGQGYGCGQHGQGYGCGQHGNCW